MNVQVNRNSLGALLLIGAGALLLFFQVFDVNIWSWFGNMWPLAVMAPGLVFLFLAWTGGRNASGFAFPGMIITGTGAILLYQNTTNHWESWAYVWTLYPAFVGAALIFNGSRNNNPNETKTGRQMLQWSVIAFVIGLVFFEMFIFGGNMNLTRYLIPVALVAVGGYLLLTRRGDTEKAKREVVPPPSPPKAKSVNPADINPELRRKIDEAIAEDQPN
ncbi:MAG: hypothetical protein IPK19_02345 [Chloroflexi bacterium]|nr:hypothetical protein [Chloroflexota bacterium]